MFHSKEYRIELDTSLKSQKIEVELRTLNTENLVIECLRDSFEFLRSGLYGGVMIKGDESMRNVIWISARSITQSISSSVIDMQKCFKLDFSFNPSKFMYDDEEVRAVLTYTSKPKDFKIIGESSLNNEYWTESMKNNFSGTINSNNESYSSDLDNIISSITYSNSKLTEDQDHIFRMVIYEKDSGKIQFIPIEYHW